MMCLSPATGSASSTDKNVR